MMVTCGKLTLGPATDNPGIENPATENPDIENPGNENPGTENPGTENLATENPPIEETLAEVETIPATDEVTDNEIVNETQHFEDSVKPGNEETDPVQEIVVDFLLVAIEIL